jgi:hypothetical protein
MFIYQSSLTTLQASLWLVNTSMMEEAAVRKMVIYQSKLYL